MTWLIGRRLVYFLIIQAFLVNCAALPQNASANTLTIFAAASLKDAFEELGRDFEANNPGTHMTFNFAGSQQLARQIAEGAPADVFAAASRPPVDTLIRAGQAQNGAPQIFAHNRLVVIFPKNNPAKLTQLQNLAQPGVKIVLAAKAVPAGQYALEFLERASTDPVFGPDFKEHVLKNVVSYEENVRTVLGKVALGEADAGIVYLSDTVQAASKIDPITIPERINPIADYPILVLKNAPNGELARRFVEYTLGTAGQATLAKYGFIPVVQAAR